MPKSNAEIKAAMRAQREKELDAVQKLSRKLKAKNIPFIIYVNYPYEGTNYIGTALMDLNEWAKLFHCARVEGGIGEMLEKAMILSCIEPDEDVQMVKDFPEEF